MLARSYDLSRRVSEAMSSHGRQMVTLERLAQIPEQVSHASGLRFHRNTCFLTYHVIPLKTRDESAFNVVSLAVLRERNGCLLPIKKVGKRDHKDQVIER